MKLFLKENRIKLYAVAGASAVAILALGIFIGVWSSKSAERDAAKNAALDIRAVKEETGTENEKINEEVLKGAVIKTVFIKCGHAVESPLEDRLTINEIRDRFPEYRISEDPGDTVMLQREIDDYCPKHLILVRRGEALKVESCDPETGKRITVKELETESDLFSQAAENELKNGLVFNELSQIDEYIENMES